MSEVLDDLNPVVQRVEREYRDENGLWGRRTRFIPSAYVRAHADGLPGGARVRSELIGRLFFWPVFPFGFAPGPTEWYRTETCPGCRVRLEAIRMSVDHIHPISKGGLEFDRHNVRFLCLRCNVRRGARSLKSYNRGAQRTLMESVPALERGR
jgi:HNH endonuclease